MPRRSAGNPEPPDLGRHAEAIVAEKLKVLSLIRALDRAGVDPREVRPLQPTLVRLAEYDGFLTAALEVLDRDRGAGGAAELGPIEKFLGVGRAVRGEVLDSLPEARRREVLRWVEEVPAHAREVWMEVEAMRRRSGRGSPPRMRSEEEIQRIADRTFSAARPRPAPVDPRVRRHEMKPLATREELPAWLERLPKGWLETIAVAHGLDASRTKPRIVADLAAHLRGAGLGAALSDLLGPEERLRLAHLAIAGRIPVDAMPEDMQGGLVVPWEWKGVPPGTFARLRGLGLAFVGSSGGQRFAAMPGELRQAVLRVIERDFPDLSRALDRAMRTTWAEKSKELPFEEAELARWKAADRAVGKRLEAAGVATPGAAVRAFFGDGPRQIHEAEAQFVAEYCALSWRPAPDAPTQAERLLEGGPTLAPDERTVLEAIVASQPSLYQIVAVTPPQGLLVADLLRGGDPLRVDDRALSLDAEPGYILPGRLYSAGPFRFIRLCGGVLDARREAVAVAWLEARCKDHCGPAGLDWARYLRERAQDLWDVVRRHRDPDR